MIYKGTDLEGYDIRDDVIDVEFEIIEEWCNEWQTTITIVIGSKWYKN